MPLSRSGTGYYVVLTRRGPVVVSLSLSPLLGFWVFAIPSLYRLLACPAHSFTDALVTVNPTTRSRLWALTVFFVFNNSSFLSTMKFILYALGLSLSYGSLTAPTVANALESSVSRRNTHSAGSVRRATMSHKRYWGRDSAKLNTTALFHEDELVKRDGTKYVFMHHVRRFLFDVRQCPTIDPP